MNVSLTPELESLVKTQVSTGAYNSASEVIRDALRLFEEREKLRQIRRVELTKKLQTGIDQANRGELISPYLSTSLKNAPMPIASVWLAIGKRSNPE